MKNSSIRCKIEPTDIDNYGHLNNAAFPKYFDRGRYDLAVQNGLDRDTLVPKGLAFLVRKASYDYIAPVLENQEVEIISNLISIEGTRAIVEQEMLRDKGVVSKCRAEYFFQNLTTGKPIRPPSSILP